MKDHDRYFFKRPSRSRTVDQTEACPVCSEVKELDCWLEEYGKVCEDCKHLDEIAETRSELKIWLRGQSY